LFPNVKNGFSLKNNYLTGKSHKTFLLNFEDATHNSIQIGWIW